MENLTSEDLKILDELLDIYRTKYAYYNMQMIVGDNFLLDYKDFFSLLSKRENELLEKLKLNDVKTKFIISLCKQRIISNYNENDFVIGLFDNDINDMSYKRLINSVHISYLKNAVKFLVENYARISYNENKLDEDFEDEYYENSNDMDEDFEDEYFENDELKEEIDNKIRNILKMQKDSHKNSAQIVLFDFVEFDAFNNLLVLIDEEIDKTDDSRILQILNRIKYNLIYLYTNIEDTYFNDNNIVVNLSYFYSMLLHVSIDELNDIKRTIGLGICGDELEHLFYLVESEMNGIDTFMKCFVRGLDLRVGSMLLDDRTLEIYEDFVKKCLILSEKKSVSDELENDIFYDIYKKIGLTVAILPTKDVSSKDCIDIVKNSIIHSSDDRKRFRTI